MDRSHVAESLPDGGGDGDGGKITAPLHHLVKSEPGRRRRNG